VCTVLARRTRKQYRYVLIRCECSTGAHSAQALRCARRHAQHVTEHVATKACTVLCSRTDTHADCHMSGSL
jgi:hypothetical protein